jgi:hypothetical protein
MPPKKKAKTKMTLPKAPLVSKPVAVKLEYKHGWMQLKEIQRVLSLFAVMKA